MRVGTLTVPAEEERNQLLSINTHCGDVDGKSVRSVCCNKHGRFLTIQVKSSEQKSLEIGKILVHVAAPGCAEDDDENLCALVAEPEVYDENIFNDDRNDGSCIPTTTTTSTTTTSTTTTSTTTLCDPTTLSRGDIEVEAKTWKKVYSHNSVGGVFADNEEAKNKNNDDENADLYSILYDLESFRKAGGFHFKLCYPEVSKCNEWVQTSNPVEESTITGFSAITLTWTKNSLDNPWLGIGLSPPSPHSLIDDFPTHDYWWTSIGTLRLLSGDKIPGPKGNLVTKNALFVEDSKTGKKKSTLKIIKTPT